MNYKKKSVYIVVIVLIATLIVPTFAIESRASEQINSYYMNVTPTTGSLAVYFSVIGKVNTTKIGCESIYVYKNVSNEWVFTESKTEDDPDMSNTNIYTHGDTIYCNGTKGVYYKVVVTIFAENSKGRDTRTETFYVTGK